MISLKRPLVFYISLILFVVFLFISFYLIINHELIVNCGLFDMVIAIGKTRGRDYFEFTLNFYRVSVEFMVWIR
jgi:hypothetical protein